MVKTVGKYDLYGTLGEGAFGKVKYAVNTETNEAVAIKILDKDKIQTRNMGAQIKKEISIMKMISHHHVVSVKDVFATSAKIFIVLEFVGGGELFDKIANEGKLPEEKARFYFKQLVEGLEHCHNNGVCHRDLKPENLLLDTDGNLKISDFGFSTLNIGDADGDGNARAELLHTTCGTPNYVAPEVLGKDGYDGKKADVWSIGVILYVLLAGYLPFDENTMAALFQKIKNADFEYPDWFSSEARDLLSKILVPDPHSRAKLSELKNHPWMQHGDSGPTPSQGNNAAAIHGAPPVVNSHPAHPPAAPAPVVKPTVTVHDTPPSPKHHNDNNSHANHHHAAPAAAAAPAPAAAAPAVTHPPVSQPPAAAKTASEPVKRSPAQSAAAPVPSPPPAAAASHSAHPPAPPAAPVQQKPLEVHHAPAAPAQKQQQPQQVEEVGGGCGCLGGGKKKDNKNYDRV